MKLRQTDRWLSTKETIGNYTIYRFQNYTLAIEHIIGLELDSNKILKPIVINIKARVISSVGKNPIICGNREEFAKLMSKLKLPLYLDSKPL